MIDVLHYLLTSVAWSVMGFAGGYFLGHMEREVHVIKESVAPDGVPPAHDHDDVAPAGGPRTRRDRIRRNFRFLILLLALVTVAQMTFASVVERRRAECQNEVNTALRADVLERARTADQDWADLRQFLVQLEDHVGNPDQVRRDVATLNELLLQRELERAQNPGTVYIPDECG